MKKSNHRKNKNKTIDESIKKKEIIDKKNENDLKNMARQLDMLVEESKGKGRYIHDR